MSRLIVKNLPNNITEDRLRDLFSSKGEITDVQLKYTSSGKFRNFAYIGYKSDCEANEALSYFQDNYIDNKKISLELCSELADPEKPASWSKYAADNRQKQKEALLKKIKAEKDNLTEQNLQKNAEIHQKILNILNKYENDPMFKEFMVLHKMDADKLNKILMKFSKASEKKALDKSVSDLEYMKSVMKFSSGNKSNSINDFKKEPKVAKDLKLFTIKIRGLPAKCKKKDLKEFFRPNLPFSVRIPRGDVKGFAYVTFKTKDKMKKALNKHKSFINGKQVFLYEFNSDNKNNKKHVEESGETNSRWKQQEASLTNEEGIAESGKIFVRNLTYTVTEHDLRELFEQYGEVTEVSLPIDKITRKIKGFGTVTFMMPEHAALAYAKIDGSIFQGRLLHLLPAKTSENINENDTSNNMSYKKMKEANDKLKANLSYNWNTLFMSYGNVAKAISDTYDVPIEDIFDPWTKTSSAVRLALGETELVAKMKEYLEENGVCLDVFGQPITARSYNTIIVKNLPYGTTCDEITEMFERFGVLKRVILPPRAVTALVEFVEPFEARAAFQNFAYSRLKNSLLKLEWAPENIFSDKAKPITNKNSQQYQQLDNDCNNDQIEDNCEYIKPEADSTLYVKNLSFDTNEDGLKKHFSKCGQIHSVIIAYNKSSKLLEKKLSNGYGFVQFKLKSSADEALKTLQHSVLDGRSIELKRTEKTLNVEVKATRKIAEFTKPTGTKILVKNVPFRAKSQELRDLFQAFGPLKSLRLPLKSSYDSNLHRGFAFVDYQLQTDANNAFKALSASTHLFGRRLVLEWAAIHEDISDIRKRTAKNYHPDEEPLKKRKAVMSMETENHDEEENYFVDNF